MNLLKNPWIVLGSMAIGVFLGLFDKPLALNIEPIGNLYLSFLQMCTIPIIISALISSIGRLMLENKATFIVKRLITAFVVGLFLASVVGVCVGFFGQPGSSVGADTRSVLGATLFQHETSPEGQVSEQPSGLDLGSLINMFVPDNFFHALDKDQSLQILFFSVVLGITVGRVKSGFSEQFIGICEVIFKAMEMAISWTMYILPFALVSLLAGTTARMGLHILVATLSYVGYVYLAAFVLIVVATFFISRYSKVSMFRSLIKLRRPMIVAFGTRSSYATMPIAFSALRKEYTMNERLMNLVVPLGVVICRYSMVLVFTVGTVYMMNLYELPITWGQIGFILVAAVMASLAGAGTPSIAAIAMISIVIGPLGVPVNVAVILLLAINPAVDPILTVVNIYLTCAATVIISKPGAIQRQENSTTVSSV